jgi:protein-disulfide isomerase
VSDTPQGQWPPPPDGTPSGGPAFGGAQPPLYGPPPGGPPPYGPPPYGPAPYGPPGPRRGRGTGLVVGLLAGAVVLIVCVAVTAYLLLQQDDVSGKPVALPDGVTADANPDGLVTMAKPGVTRPVVDVFEDFQCPVCREFHRVNDATLKEIAAQGKGKVVYHPIVIFSSEPMQGNSLRASAAAHCVRDGARWLSYQDQLFAHQPVEGSPGFAADDLVAYGSAAGVTDSGFASCVRSGRYTADVRSATQTAIAGGINGTPTVKLNGTPLELNETLSATGLRAAVDAAR